MHRLLALLLTINAILLASLLWQRSHVAHGGAVASINGDVNGDEKLDVADGIYIINHQFRGGPAPVPLECPPVGKGLPDTGQTKCYDQSGTEIACGSATCSGQDGRYSTGCPLQGRFIDNGDGTVTDTCTGLMWQKDAADTNENGESNSSDRLNWCLSLAYCENLTFADHDDWRLPNVQELRSIVDYGRQAPSIDPVFSAIGGEYWSSTSFVGNPDFVWLVFFPDGRDSIFDRARINHVRAVRSRP